MKRSIAITSALVLALSSLLFVAEASARAGGGSSGGSRGSRSYSAPAPKSPSQVSPSRPTAPASPVAPAPMQAPQRSGWGGMLGGLLVGGLIGSLLFGGMGGGLGHGMFGGIGLMEIVLIGGLIAFAIMWMRRRQAAGSMGTPAYAGGYGAGSSSGGWQPSGASTYSGGGSSAAPVAVLDAPAEPSDLD